jgi:hypothetical protein
MQTAVARAFVQVLGDNGSVLDREGIRISPAYLMRLHCVIVEIPEGSWAAGGQTIDTKKIGKLIGATQGPNRLAEANDRLPAYTSRAASDASMSSETACG